MSKTKTKNNKSNEFIIIISIIAIILMLVIAWLNCLDKKTRNVNFIKQEESMIEHQKKLEENFTTKGYTIENPNIKIDPYENSPLTALVMFETEEDVAPEIIIEGKDEQSTFKHKSKKARKHYLEIYGLYPDKDNKVIINYKTKNEDIHKELKIKTGKLPSRFILPTEIKNKKEKLNNDLYFISPSGYNKACAYDVNGDVRWYLSTIALWDNTRLKNGHLIVSTERLINMPYYVTGLYEIDMFGKIYKEYSLPGGYHHDYFELPNGNYLVATNDFNNEYGTVEDFIVELDTTTGKIVKEFDLKNILNMNDGKSENWISYDWFHNNSLWYDEKTNSIILSGRHKDSIINISYETGKLNWIIGDKTNWDEEYHKYFFTPVNDENFEWQWSQHAAMVTPEGYIFVFDNGNNRSKIKSKYKPAKENYSRGVMYKIDTDKMTIEQIYQYGKERGSDFYSPYISDVDYIEKDHYIVHSGGIVRDSKGNILNEPAGFVDNPILLSDTVEIKNDEVIFEMKIPANNYRVEKQNLYSNSNYNKKEGKRLGTLGKTEISYQDLGPIKSIKEDKEYKSKNIQLKNEIDRLSVTGQFKREDDLEIILYNNLISNHYKIPVTKRPYTALCVDAFTEEETKNGIRMTRFINKEGLKGNYSIYIKLNGKIYNTEYVIEI